ncbi:MAG: ribonuclease HII [Candidatus Paceibacterota bacterium]|jgi:ribonuclease HII
MRKKYIIGIDEVGRGPLAGPVFVAVACLPRDFKIRNKELGKLADSKKLSPQAREKWFEYFKNHPEIKFAVAQISPKVIDRINISHSANLAALRAFHRLASGIKCHVPDTYLDGGLYLGNGKNRLPGKTIIKGDEKITAIKIASIIAKVKRDALMKRLAKRYPRYGLEIHKGYGTRAHFVAIKKLGPSEIHRLTFLHK